MARRSALRAWALLTAWTVIVLCTVLLFANEYFFQSRFWRLIVIPVSKFSLPAARSQYTRGFKTLPPLLDGFFAKQLIFTWPPILAIALLSIWVRNPPFHRTRRAIGSFGPSASGDGRPALTHFKKQAKLFFSYQLPPRRFWAHVLDNGFSVVDLIVVFMWITLNACWIVLGCNLIWTVRFAPYHKKNGAYMNGSYTTDYLDMLGYATAWASIYNLIFVFLPVPRNSFLQYMFNSDFSVLIKYHRWLGHGTLWIALIHGVAYYACWLSDSVARFRKDTFLWQSFGSINYLAGSIAFFPFGLMLWITTVPWIRRRFFNVFLSTHIIGFLGFILFTEIHYPPTVWWMPGLALYFLDVTFRLSQWGVTSGLQCRFISDNQSFVTLSLKFNKAANVRPSQFLFLNAPSISRFAWHPMSIADVQPGSDGLSQDVTIHVKAYGSWTKELIYQLAQHGTIPVRADGPYGGGSGRPEWAEYDTVIIVAGGIGATPVLGMLSEMNAARRQNSTELRKAADKDSLTSGGSGGLPNRVHLIWTVRNRDELQLLNSELLAAAEEPGSWLKLHLFHTSKAEEYTLNLSEHEDDDKSLSDLQTASKTESTLAATRQLQPYGFGDLHWALAHFLAIIGAFFACLAVHGYILEKEITSKDGPSVTAVGVLLSLAFVVGAMGLPALIIFPLHMIRYRRHVNACKEAHRSFRAAVGNESADPSKSVSFEHKEAIKPSADEKVKIGLDDMESGRGGGVHFGRPDLQRLITAMVTELPPGQRIGVIAAGPPSLVVDARLATHDASALAAKLGMRGIPELAFSNHSFAF